MTYAEAVTYRASLEAAVANGRLSVTRGSNSVTFASGADLRAALNQVIRDITDYERKTAGQTNPGVRTPTWT